MHIIIERNGDEIGIGDKTIKVMIGTKTFRLHKCSVTGGLEITKSDYEDRRGLMVQPNAGNQITLF